MKIKTKIGIFALAIALFASPVFAELFSGSGVGPTATFTANPTATVVDNSISFDASASRDAFGKTAGLKYRWDFESTYSWTSWSSYSKTTHTFSESGNFGVRLQVKDSDGIVDETETTITIYNRQNSLGPRVQFSVDPEIGDTSTNFHFIVETFSQIFTPENQIEVRWDWDRDGKWDTGWSTAREFDHTFPDTALHEVWIEARDIDGTTTVEHGFYVDGEEKDSSRDKVIGRILVEDPTAPIASFTTWPVEILQGATVHFDASESRRAVDFRWDFEGDGRFENSWSPENVKIQHVYSTLGVFDATLEVRNSAGEIDATTRTISVTDDENILPTVGFSLRNLTNSSLGNSLAILRDEIKFTASVDDEDGAESKAVVRWDFDGDGIWDTTFATTKTATHKFISTGTKYPRVQVRDELGGVATATGQIEVVANTAPRAALVVSPTAGIPDSYFRFNASGSRDDQTGTSNLEYRFDFDGDGLFDTEFKSARSYSRKISRTGNLTATVEVRDQLNATSSATASFEIVPTGEPLAGFTADPRVGTFSTNFEFDASNSQSASLDGDLKYRWDFDYRGENDIDFSTGWSTSAIYRHRFSEIGDHSVRLLVKNSAGKEDDAFGKIKIHAESAALDYLTKKNLLDDSEKYDGLITRAELAKIIVRATKISAATPRVQQFTDVAVGDANAKYISAVAARGWISPRNNFAWQPDGSVNRAEAAKIVLSALLPRVATKNSLSISDVPESAWYARFAETAVAENLLALDFAGKFNPSAPTTRAEIARMVATLLQKYSNTKSASLFDPSEIFAKILAQIDFPD